MSRARAINEKCRECIYDPQPGNGTWRQQTEACTATDCALYEYRPRSKAGVEVRSPPPGEEMADFSTSIHEEEEAA